MGLFLSKISDLFSYWGQTVPSKILLLGLDNAGKTTILYKIKLNENIQTIPTIGFNVEEVSPCKGVSFTVWDVGGQKKIRNLWNYYYQGTQGLIYVIDSADVERLAEASEQLHAILENDCMRGVPVVIIANKQDLPNAAKCTQIVAKLELEKLRMRNDWFIQGSCAVTGEGIYEAMKKMADMVKENSLNSKNFV